MAVTGLRNLCTPAYVYLVISLVTIIIMAIQNFGDSKMYCLGTYTCEIASVSIVFLLKIVYILVWTWILNIICKSGNEPVAWFFVLFPYILLFILIAYMLFL